MKHTLILPFVAQNDISWRFSLILNCLTCLYLYSMLIIKLCFTIYNDLNLERSCKNVSSNLNYIKDIEIRISSWGIHCKTSQSILSKAASEHHMDNIVCIYVITSQKLIFQNIMSFVHFQYEVTIVSLCEEESKYFIHYSFFHLSSLLDSTIYLYFI